MQYRLPDGASKMDRTIGSVEILGAHVRSITISFLYGFKTFKARGPIMASALTSDWGEHGWFRIARAPATGNFVAYEPGTCYWAVPLWQGTGPGRSKSTEL
eukprot:SAG31_NODE_5863_length_2285_cov_1.317932_1_plen_101_part_00